MEQAGVNRSLLANVESRNLKHFGQIVRGENKSLDKGITQRTLEKKKTESSVDG